MGTILEFYDITLYGFFAALIAPFFFPSEDSTTSLLASLGTFAAGFVMRPVGGLFFGHIGDRYGRKQALLLSILLMTIPTFLIGILPTYEKIGLLSPFVLISCRLLQGLCAGGEYSSAAVFIAERYPGSKKGFSGGLLCASAFLGAVIGSGIGSVCTLSFMPTWAWRIPFWLGGVFGGLAFLYRRKVEETHAFEILEKEHKIKASPFRSVLKDHKLSLLCTFVIGASVQIPFYIVSLYMSLILAKKLGISVSMSLLLNTTIMVIWMVLLPVVGWVLDRHKSFTITELSLGGIILSAYPLFLLIERFPSPLTLLLAQCVISFLGVWYMGVSPSLMPRLFPVGARITGMGVAFSLGQSLFSGTAPLVVTALTAWTGQETMPAFYLIFTSFLGWGAIRLARVVLQGSISPALSSVPHPAP